MCPGWSQVLIDASSTKVGKLYNLYDPLKHAMDFPFIPKKYNPSPRANSPAVFRPSCLWAEMTILYLKGHIIKFRIFWLLERWYYIYIPSII